MNLRIFVLLILSVGTAAAQPVGLDVRVVGFEGSGASRYVGRNSTWLPILVELKAEGGQARDVSLRCVTEDIDGDEVAYSETPIVLTPNQTKRVWLYTLMGRMRAGREATVVVQNMNGEPLATSDPIYFDPVVSDFELIVDLSAKQLSALSILDAGGDYVGLAPERRFNRGRCLARLQSDELPDRWFGLEAVDVIVWDNPAALPSTAQQEALRKWVERGGQLVLGIGSSWAMLEASRLAPLLPYEGAGDLVEVDKLPRYARLVGGDDPEWEDDTKIPVVLLEPTSDAQTLFRETVHGKQHDLVAMKTYGSGRVIATTTQLQLLLRGQDQDELSRTLPLFFDLTPTTEAYLQSEADQINIVSVNDRQPLRDSMLLATEFRSRASLLVLAAFIFVGVYVLVATWASWGWLQARKATQASWVVFAGCAIAASLLSVGAVQVIRGTSDATHTFSIVDMEAGGKAAQARVWAGYRSARSKRVNLRLEGEDSFLRGAIGDADEATYVTRERYTAEVTKGQVRDAPLRATLKQFQGYWEGEIDGAIHGQLVADRSTGKLLQESWISNDTPLRFTAGYLLYVDPRLSHLGEVAPRPAGLHNRLKYWGHTSYPPAANVLALALPEWKPQTRLSQIGVSKYEQYDNELQNYLSRPNRKDEERPMLETLWHLQNLLWSNSFRVTAFGSARVETDVAACMLYATQHMYLSNGKKGSFSDANVHYSTELLPRGDITHWLRGGEKGQAVLLLYSNEPAAPQLVSNGTALQPKRGAALYRVRIPIRWRN